MKMFCRPMPSIWDNEIGCTYFKKSYFKKFWWVLLSLMTAPVMIKFQPIWASFIQFDHVWANEISLIQFDQVWCNLIKFNPIWSSLIQFDQVWSNLIKFDPIWSSLNQSDQVWSNLSKFDPICSSFNVFLTYQCHQVLNDTHGRTDGRTETNYNT